MHAEGYVNVSKSDLKEVSAAFNYVFNYTDHLGNIRLSYSQDPSTNVLKVIEENHYYPFGLKHTGYNSDKMMLVKEASVLKIKPVPPLFKTSYNYRFQSQEFQEELGLNAYFFRYRTYYPDLGRFLQVDPVAESYVYNSTYAFAENRVIESIDLEGKESWYTQDGSLATGNKQSGPLSAKYRAKNNLYSPSELQQLKARTESNTGSTFTQDNRTNTQRSANDVKWRKHYNDIEATKDAMKNHDNIGSPYTQKRVMEGVAHGMVDIATGEVIGKLFQGAKMYINAAKAEKTIIVIGEGMGRVHGAKSSLLESGVKNVEVFTPSAPAMDEWNALISGGKHLSDDVVKNTMLYQENVNWIKKATESGKTILDIGNDGRVIESTFYKMEKQTIYGTQ
jgi:RHS repeat-associated protein